MAPTSTTNSASPSYFSEHQADLWPGTHYTLEDVVCLTGAAFVSRYTAWLNSEVKSIDTDTILAASLASMCMTGTLVSALDPSADLVSDSTQYDAARTTIEPLIAAEHRSLFDLFSALVKAVSRGTDNEKDMKKFGEALIKNEEFEAAVFHKVDEA